MARRRIFAGRLLAAAGLLFMACAAHAQKGVTEIAPGAFAAERTYTFAPEGETAAFLDLFAATIPAFVAKVGGEDVCAILDTGASHSIVSIDLANRLGLAKLQSLGATKTLSAAISAHLTSPVRIEIPGQFEFESSMVAAPMPDLVCPGNLKVGLALGMDVLDHISVLVDNPRQRIAFHPSGRLTPGDKKHLRIDWSGGHIDGLIEGEAVRMKVDTGINVPLLLVDRVFETLFSDKARTPAEPIGAAGGIIAVTERVADARLGIGGIEIVVAAQSFPDTGSAAPILIGNPVFGTNAAIFDAGRNVIYLLALDNDDD
ncbi:MAG: aspartyl protease family protein [Erythrobacter sp.]